MSRRRAPLALNPALAPSDSAPSQCRSGGTGRHAILRGWWGNPWGFESPLRHHMFSSAVFGVNVCRPGSAAKTPDPPETSQLRLS